MLLTDVDIDGVIQQITSETSSFWWIVESKKTHSTLCSVSTEASATTYIGNSRKSSSIRKEPDSRYTPLGATAAVSLISETEQTVGNGIVRIVIVTNIVYIHKAITINGRPSQR